MLAASQGCNAVTERCKSVTRQCWRGRVYAGSDFFFVFASVFLTPLSDAFTLSPVGVVASGFCSP